MGFLYSSPVSTCRLYSLIALYWQAGAGPPFSSLQQWFPPAEALPLLQLIRILRQIDCSLISGSSIIKGWSEPSSLQSPPQCGEWWSPSLLNSSIPAVSTAWVSPEFYDNLSPPQTASSAATDSLSYLQGQVSSWPWTLAGSCCCIYHGSSLSATSSLHITHNIHSHL